MNQKHQIKELIEKEKISNAMMESMKTENHQKQTEIQALEQEIETLKQINIKTRNEFNQQKQVFCT